MFWTGPGKVLIAWDMGQGPTWDADAKRKTLGECEVWRSVDPLNTGSAAVPIGDTSAEGFLDTDVKDGGVYYYWIMSELRGGGLHQIGPVVDVTVPSQWPADRDVTPPSEVDDLKAVGVADGIELSWLAASDAESGLLAYFIYDSNQDQPDSIVWANEDVQEGSERRTTFVDVLPSGTLKGYIVKAIDTALNLSDGGDKGPVWGVAGGRRNLIRDPQFGYGQTFDTGYWRDYNGVYLEDASLEDMSAGTSRLRIWAAWSAGGWWFETPPTLSIDTTCPLGFPPNCSHALHYAVPPTQPNFLP